MHCLAPRPLEATGQRGTRLTAALGPADVVPRAAPPSATLSTATPRLATSKRSWQRVCLAALVARPLQLKVSHEDVA